MKLLFFWKHPPNKLNQNKKTTVNGSKLRLIEQHKSGNQTGKMQ